MELRLNLRVRLLQSIVLTSKESHVGHLWHAMQGIFIILLATSRNVNLTYKFQHAN